MWHASVSLQHRRKGFLDDERTVEQAAVGALRGVGGDFEWWYWNTAKRVGHLRVPVTTEEHVLIPPGLVVTDAGEEGNLRPRTL